MYFVKLSDLILNLARISYCEDHPDGPKPYLAVYLSTAIGDKDGFGSDQLNLHGKDRTDLLRIFSAHSQSNNGGRP